MNRISEESAQQGFTLVEIRTIASHRHRSRGRRYEGADMRESLHSPMLRSAGFAQAPPAQGLGGLWRSWRCEGPECTDQPFRTAKGSGRVFIAAAHAVQSRPGGFEYQGKGHGGRCIQKT